MARKAASTSSFHRANKNLPGEWVVYHLLLVAGLKRAFSGLYVAVDPATLRLRGRTRYPVIFCMTHSGWFDGHIAAVLNKRIFRHDAYLMMEEPNLSRYFFFTWAGVFGIDRDHTRNALASILYITDILKGGPNRALWMFPQGIMRHPDARPLELFGGAANIARRVGRCYIVPVAVRYDFTVDQAPGAFVRIGPPILFDANAGPDGLGSSELTERLRLTMEAEADQLHQDVAAYRTNIYKRILAGRGSVNKGWDVVMRVARALRGQPRP
jgi:1-acyl-sn-glycerol-3-phosphate acyltransferase